MCTDPYSNDVTALICLNKKSLEALANQLNKSSLSFEQLCDDPIVNQHVFASIQTSCKELGFKRREFPIRVKLVKEEWSQENNLLTAAFKLRRKQVYDFYKADIEKMYADIKLKANDS